MFAKVKEYVTARQVVESYGIKVGRNGMACCPFHDDRHPSMKTDRNYYCFGCGVHGDAIDFTARLYGLSQYDAAVKLIHDFALPIETGKNDRNLRKYSLSNEEKRKRKIIQIREKLEKWLDHATDVLICYVKLLERWKIEFCPKTENDEWSELFTEALGNLSVMNYYMDVLMYGTGEEILEFFKARRKEVEKIEKRIEEYQRGVAGGTGDDYGQRDVYCSGY